MMLRLHDKKEVKVLYQNYDADEEIEATLISMDMSGRDYVIHRKPVSGRKVGTQIDIMKDGIRQMSISSGDIVNLASFFIEPVLMLNKR